MSNPYNVGSTSVTLNGYAQTGGTSVSSKGIEVTLAADTGFPVQQNMHLPAIAIQAAHLLQ